MNDPADSKLPDLRYVRELAKVFRQYGLDELEIESGDQRILLRQADYASPPMAPAVGVASPAPTLATGPAAPPAGPTPEVGARDEEFITSPFVGTFYRAPRPDAPPFVEVGKRVQAGETVCIVEAMKLFNEIEADFGCVIEEILAEPGQSVEYGAKLFRVRRQ